MTLNLRILMYLLPIYCLLTLVNADIYQEDANSTSCSGAWSLTNPCTNVYDGDWDTYGKTNSSDTAYFFANYTKPSYALSTSEWVIGYGDGLAITIDNFAIPTNCWLQTPLQFRVESQSNFLGDFNKWTCWNGTDWYELFAYGTDDANVFEEGINWHDGCDAYLSTCKASSWNANYVYCLTQNISTTTSCMRVTANNVTLNLKQYTIQGDSGASDYGVYAPTSGYAHNLTIKNGTIKSFGFAVWLTSRTTWANIEDLIVNASSYLGIYLNDADYANVENTNVVNSTRGVGLNNCDHCELHDSLITNTSLISPYYGLTIANSKSTIVDNITSSSSYYGLVLQNNLSGSLITNISLLSNTKSLASFLTATPASTGPVSIVRFSNNYGLINIYFDNDDMNITSDVALGTNPKIGQGWLYLNATVTATANITLYGTPCSETTCDPTRNGIKCTDCTYSSSLSGATATFATTSVGGNWTIEDSTKPTFIVTRVADDYSPPYIVSISNPTVYLTTNENADCRATLDGDESYVQMSDDFDCSGDGTTSQTCSLNGLTNNAQTQVHFACNDSYGNYNTAADNVNIIIQVGTSIPDGGGGTPDIVKTTLGELRFSPHTIFDNYLHFYGTKYTREVTATLPLFSCNFTKFDCVFTGTNTFELTYPTKENAVPNTPNLYVTEQGQVCVLANECYPYTATLQGINFNWRIPSSAPNLTPLISPNGFNIIPCAMVLIILYLINRRRK